MAPEGEEPVIKMKQYSTEFNAGQIGMVLVQGNIFGDIDDGDPTNDDPAGRLQQIEVLKEPQHGESNHGKYCVFDEISRCWIQCKWYAVV